jgi:NADH-quinone oxidoreductase subunit J
MDPGFLLLAALTLGSAAAAMALRNLVHCVLCAAAGFLGLAALYLRLNAEFVGFAQVLVYVGAVAILMAIALLLTRNLDSVPGPRAFAPWVVGVGIAGLAAGVLVSAVLGSGRLARPASSEATVPVAELGRLLVTRHVLALEAVGLLLTAAALGAAILAMREPKEGA